ncbi:hypothetical protein GDO86_014750 [Hymenochirus boettgeri]|uniref:RING-type domain-containing protein n=1 Tax=Hymenochirus boettgeri TaxID=247094 RepID=A0A8T2JUW9_9PIPI|nr:hypothetical protein GDO86_014750 [Hymenochirus boettgeri]
MATETPEPPEGESPYRNECPICYSSYDNVFKTPLLLPCAHTFCMECLCRLCLFIKHLQGFPCPLCRASAVIPTGGIPKLPVNLEIVAQFPQDKQNLQEVWVEGHKLCWIRAGNFDPRKNSLVTVQLLSNHIGSNPARPEGMITVRPSGFSILCRNLWALSVTILAIGIFMFAIVFIPVFVFHR